jgi:dipeptidyl aminopeptidase/acylaminoacyl peptidase
MKEAIVPLMSTLGIAAALSVALGVCAWLLLGRLIVSKMLDPRGHVSPDVERPEDRGFATERFWIPVDAEHRLHAWIIRPEGDGPFPCVVMVHGFHSHKDCLWSFPDEPGYQGSMMDQGAESLCRAGFAIVAIDLRNHGQSDRHGQITLGQDEADDVIAALRFLQNEAGPLRIDSTRIGLRGESMGAVTCLIATARLGAPDEAALRPTTTVPNVRALWCDSPFADASRVVGDFIAHVGISPRVAPAVRFWLNRVTGRDLRLSSPIRHARRIGCPVFLVHSEDDRLVGIHHFEELASLDWKVPPELWRLAGHGHNRLWKEPDYHQRQIDFFKRHLSDSSRSVVATER